MRGANLQGTDLRAAKLDGTDLSGAYLWQMTFANNDLRKTKGLLEFKRGGHFTIDLPTVRLPQDGSALHFLRGAGVPDEWIDFYRATMMQTIQYHSCFISYASQDIDIAKRLHADLQDNGVRCWFAPHDLVPGDHFREAIDQAIQMQEKLLLILSQHSVQSHWVEHEARRAINREINQKRVILFPIRIDDTILTSASTWAQDLRENRHIGDFTQWETNKAYQEKFLILLKQLKATERI